MIKIPVTETFSGQTNKVDVKLTEWMHELEVNIEKLVTENNEPGQE